MQAQLVALGSTPSKADLALKEYVAQGWVPVTVVVHGTSFIAMFIQDDFDPAVNPMVSGESGLLTSEEDEQLALPLEEAPKKRGKSKK